MKRILSFVSAFAVILTCLLAPMGKMAVRAEDEKAKPYVLSNGFLYNIREKTLPSEFDRISHLTSSVESDGFVGSGDVAQKIGGGTCIVVVHGDPDGDGRVTSSDYVMTKRSVLGTYKPSEVQLLAMKSGESLITSDYIRIKRHVLDTYDLFSVDHFSSGQGSNGVRIAYIPLDNRPVNYDRVGYLAASAGFELLIPQEDLFRTALDNMPKNSNGGTCGDRAALLEWLKSVENSCDYYVISLDQMLSGGLVSSRWLSNTDLTFEKEIADYLIELSKTKHVVYFDTVMRLASTVGYMGYDLDTYNALREYGMIARATLTGDDLTVQNIIAGYRYDKNGKKLAAPCSEAKLTQYLSARERKLLLTEYILTSAGDDIEYFFVGVDDSSPETTIQTNEINYISSIAGKNFCLFAGADELGMMGIARTASSIYGGAQAKVTYFGNGAGLPADAYDIGTLSENVEKHLQSVGATLTGSETNSLSVLVLTKDASVEEKAALLVKKAQQNIQKLIPTVIVDCSGEIGILQKCMTDSELPLSMLLGYSNWNTVGNALGISISQGITRYLYLYGSKTVTDSSNKAFLKSMTFAYIKDISYKYAGISPGQIMSSTSPYGGKTLLDLINSSDIMVGTEQTASHKSVSVSDFRYPWDRAFEITFDISVG